MSFYVVYCLLLLKIPNPYHALTLYWYLTCLFSCHVILKRVMDKGVSSYCLGVFSAVVVSYLLIFWSMDYSVYLSPFNSMFFVFDSLGVYAYRFCLGFFGSLFIILIAKWIMRYRLFKCLATLGKYTLVTSTVSVI